MDSGTRAERLYEFRKHAKAEWVLAEPKIVDFWEAQSRTKIARQPKRRDDVIEAVRVNPSKRFQQIAADIGNCCSSTIHATHSGCAMDTQLS